MLNSSDSDYIKKKIKKKIYYEINTLKQSFCKCS